MRLIRGIALRIPQIVGSPAGFLTALVLVLLWIGSGWFLGWNDTWLLWPSAIASVVTFVIACSLQYTQNRDTRAIQLKLDEILRAHASARTELVKLESLEDHAIDQIEREAVELRDRSAPFRG